MDNAIRVAGRDAVVGELVVVRARSGRLLVQIEDIHWAEPEVLRQFARLAQASRELPVVLVMTTRIVGDSIEEAWRAEAGGVAVTTMELGPLRADEARGLAEAFRSVDPALLARCIDRSGGNPLFLEQPLRNLDDLASNELPGTIHGIVQARLDVLGADNRAALQAASVLGQRFVPDALAHLLARESFDPSPLVRPAGADLHFAHALIRDGAYESLLKPRRLALHRRAGDCFAERDPGLQARDLELAEDDEAPAAYLAVARHHDSVLQLEAALALIARGRALVAPDDIAFELVCLEGDILRAVGRSIEAIDGLRAAATLAQGGAQVCRVEIAIAQAARQANRYEDALASLARAESAARALDWPKELATIHYLRGAICFPPRTDRQILRGE